METKQLLSNACATAKVPIVELALKAFRTGLSGYLQTNIMQFSKPSPKSVQNCGRCARVTLACLLVVACSAAPQQNPQDVQILRYDNNVDVDGYNFQFETSDGTSRQEEGKVDNPAAEDAALIVKGQYSYVAPDGKHITVVFTAGPEGFQPKTSVQKK
ncbi:Flexible cuticle protein 12 [Eumeta japonica]|uniref:Flexible cuticle protein 12 n=1 Tax=Eumeta variegata TaxID=151549 RepID=A0A4C1YB96_EUMVA|nr:Flexible cuticle protein 12 [Eumeta japonica]